nr:MAG TPA: hypothetical protein [Caudoviricetes sp.]
MLAHQAVVLDGGSGGMITVHLTILMLRVMSSIIQTTCILALAKC